MKKIEEIIFNIFDEYNYIKVEINNYEIPLYMFHRIAEKDFSIYVVEFRDFIPRNYLSFVIPEMREAVDAELMEIDSIINNYHTKIEKNMYLISCLKSDAKKISNNEILEIEEDPYFFKKSIIRYSESDVSKLEINSINSIKPYSDFIIKTISDEEGFTKYKENVSAYPEYNISLEIMMALPFLNIFTETKQFPDIEETLKNKLNKDDLLKLNALIQNFMEERTEPSLEDLENILIEKNISDLI